MTDFNKKIHSHPSVLCANSLVDICKPLEKLNINYFGHALLSTKGELSALNNHPEFLLHYLRNHYYNADIHTANTTDLGKYVIWDNIELDRESDKMNREAIDFGVDHTFTIIDKDVRGTHYYHFSSNLIGKSINQEYLRNIDLLKAFINHFNEQVSSTTALKKAYSTTFTLNESTSTFLANPHQCEVSVRDEFLNLIKSRQNSSSLLTANQHTQKVISDYYQSILSKRELDCLYHTLLGKTAKLVAMELGISRRTVEDHIASIKLKIKVFSKAELFEKVINDLAFHK